MIVSENKIPGIEVPRMSMMQISWIQKSLDLIGDIRTARSDTDTHTTFTLVKI